MAVHQKGQDTCVSGQAEVQGGAMATRGSLIFEREEKKMPDQTELKEGLPTHVYYELVATGQLNFLTPEEERKEFERIRALAESIKKDFQPR